MLKSETAMLLAKAALIDNRNIDQATVEAWHEIISDIDYADALQAITNHRRESTEYLTPAHIVAGAKKIRAERSTESARQRALTAKASRPKELEFSDYQRMVDRPEFKAAFEAGRIEGNARRAYKTELRRTGSHKAASAAYVAVQAAGHEA